MGMWCTTLFMVSCVSIYLILSHVQEVEAGAPPQDCWNLVTFPAKCGIHGKKKCFKEMESKYQQRFLQCTCKNLKPEPKSPKDEHDCTCQRANPYECNS
ncbi:unnamed protein product [Arabidopsis thaliana]|uniref:Uncharacterized protein n=1 Tax=Arabidopsis thaliana TaxID=3702 RepID=A0A654FV41_ARATH|nr:unnamed protein product [Arabidopsis thaliana]VYS64758.1 unnamed protein product [Arabidopsis thaliana]